MTWFRRVTAAEANRVALRTQRNSTNGQMKLAFFLSRLGAPQWQSHLHSYRTSSDCLQYGSTHIRGSKKPMQLRTRNTAKVEQVGNDVVSKSGSKSHPRREVVIMHLEDLAIVRKGAAAFKTRSDGKLNIVTNNDGNAPRIIIILLTRAISASAVGYQNANNASISQPCDARLRAQSLTIRFPCRQSSAFRPLPLSTTPLRSYLPPLFCWHHAAALAAQCRG